MYFRRLAMLLFAAHLWPAAHGATITVTTLDDVVDSSGGQCALREAVANANNDGQTHVDCAGGDGNDDTIVFNGPLFNGGNEATIVLEGLELFIADGGDELTIDAGTSRRLTITTQSTQRLVRVDGISRFEMRNVTLQGGSDGFGGALSVFATDVVLDGVHFIDNSVDALNQSGAGLYLSTGSNSDTLTIRDCLFQNNDSPRQGGGVYLQLNHALTAMIEDCEFSLNTSQGGGAIYTNVSNNVLDGAVDLTIRRSVFFSNSAIFGGGAVHVVAVDEEAGVNISVEQSSFTANSTEFFGAAIQLDNGPGAPVFSANVSQSTFFENIGARTTGALAKGGAIAVEDVDLEMSNSLFYRNSSDSRGGGLFADYSGSVLARSMSMIGNSFVENDLIEPGAAGRALFVEPPTVASLLSATVRGNLFQADPMPTVNASVCGVSQGSIGDLDSNAEANLSDTPDCLFAPTDILAAPGVQVETTTDDERPLVAYAAAQGPATDAWPAASCQDAANNPLTVDLIGGVRPSDGDGVGPVDCDIGAFERPDAGLLSVVVGGSGTGTVTSDIAGIDCGADCSEPLAGGSEVALVASADAGSVFTGWGGECSGTGACMITVSGDQQVTAEFSAAPSSLVTVSTSGDGLGRVTSSVSGIACPPTCTASFADGSTVSLTATAESDSEFTGWSGACSGTGSCDVTASGNPAADAEFTATDFVVEVAVIGSGSGSVVSQPGGIDCPDDCGELYPRTETVTLTASPDPGSAFLGWSAPCSGSGDCVLDMDLGPYAVDARMEDLSTISVSLAGVGNGRIVSTPAGIDCPGDCSEVFPNTTEVSLTPTPEPGSVFVQWNLAPPTCTGTNPCVFTVTTDDEIEGIFQAGVFPLSVTVEGNGTVTSSPSGIDCPEDCDANYANGSMITLTPAADPDAVFTAWSGACTGNGPCIVTMDQARSVIATFLSKTIFGDRFESP